ncbi:PPC domain-containing protein [Aquisphaera insulae]|uniref:PPC domain-containing protein n=1 Tax=Aquisphaera insulae TaxID=2712864 RepID=UPI0013EB206F|nr:PPC domain-containing protein [Aquisphaera insulae]
MRIARYSGVIIQFLRPSSAGLVAAVVVCLAVAPSARSQPPAPLIDHVYPAGGARGSTFEVTVTGTNLQGATAVRIGGPDVATAVIASSVKPDTVRAAVTLAPDAPLGVHDIRIATPGGVSNRYRFVVGDLPEVVETEPNNELAQAQNLAALPVVLNGHLILNGADSDRDLYRFRATAGQNLVFRMQGRSLLPYIPDAVPGWLDGRLAVLDAAGNELAALDDYNLGPDPVLVFPVPRDGEYLIEVRDVLFRGRPAFVYRVAAGVLPHVDWFTPLGGRRGTETTVELHGVNLPASSLKLGTSDPAASFLSIAFNQKLPAAGSASNVLPFAIGADPEVFEAEPNNEPGKAQKVAIPVAINARIDHDGDQDFYRFTATKGQVVSIETQARRLGSPVDTMMYLTNAAGGELARNDEWVDPDPVQALQTHHADSRIVFTLPDAGDYVVRIKNLQPGGGETFAYRLLIGPPRPDFRLLVTPDNPRLTRGDTAILTVKALRLDWFGGEIALRASGLPAGFAASTAVIPAGQDTARLTITAPMTGAPSLVAPTVSGTGKVGPADVTRDAHGNENIMQAFSYRHDVPTEEIVAAVLEPHLLTLGTGQPPDKILEAPQGKEVPVVVRAERHGGAKGPVQITLDGPPAGITLKTSPTVIPPDKAEATAILVVAPTAPVGPPQTVILSGSMNAGAETATRFAPAVSIRVLPAPKK